MRHLTLVDGISLAQCIILLDAALPQCTGDRRLYLHVGRATAYLQAAGALNLRQAALLASCLTPCTAARLMLSLCRLNGYDTGHRCWPASTLPPAAAPELPMRCAFLINKL